LAELALRRITILEKMAKENITVWMKTKMSTNVETTISMEDPLAGASSCIRRPTAGTMNYETRMDTGIGS